MTAHAPLLAITVALPLVGALLVTRSLSVARARRIGALVSGLVVLALAALLAALVSGGGGRVEDPAVALGPLGTRPLFGLDPLSAVLAMTNAITAFAVLVGAPRARDERPRITALLLTEGLILTMVSTLDLVVLAVAFAGLTFPARARQRGRREGPQSARLLRYVFVVGALPLALALGLVLVEGAPLGLGLDLRAIGSSGGGSPIVLGLVLVAVFVRMALVPGHSWLPALTQYGPLGTTVLLVASQSGAYLFVRLVIPSLGDHAHELTTVLTVIGALSALYASALAVVTDDLRRLIGWLSASQAGLMLVGLSSLEPDGTAGAIVYWISYGTAVTGLALTTWAVQARTGTTRISELGGLVRSAPRLTVAFAAFSVASVGFPGSLGFVAEDLLVHGVVEAHPVFGVVMVIATALCGIALIRALFGTFFGPTKIDAPADLRSREGAVVAGLAALVFGLGLWPAPLIELVDLARPLLQR
ncbi:NAD(P)H-quinone oxidoreductase chain 4 1 [Enhygromyxa salina]|uniref:NAD(P)H-quinone oxidoreductase chain 4 1 n=1 Tax=Enhygromyxa salina TaxID=215803 RepID=A0A2S9XE95_9BACT|nr:proton-conducting transporter membrane subunit [Enhygromyxa salina]PRP91186.1 NAD(P)H-quinone oxidoreductase chain 4 1 [Enhygromyxa salina]